MEQDKQFDDKLREIGEEIKQAYFAIPDDGKKDKVFAKYLSEKTFPAVPRFGK